MSDEISERAGEAGVEERTPTSLERRIARCLPCAGAGRVSVRVHGRGEHLAYVCPVCRGRGFRMAPAWEGRA